MPDDPVAPLVADFARYRVDERVRSRTSTPPTPTT